MRSRVNLNANVALRRLVSHIPSGQLTRYLLVGTWNTMVAYGLYAILTWLLTGRIPHAYMAASVIGTVVNITVAYCGYKFFVFKTKGNYIREYLRCFAVYGVGTLINLVLLPIVVNLAGLLLSDKRYAPYVGGAILTAGNVVLSFFGHKKFSFAHATAPPLVRETRSGDVG